MFLDKNNSANEWRKYYIWRASRAEAFAIYGPVRPDESEFAANEPLEQHPSTSPSKTGQSRPRTYYLSSTRVSYPGRRHNRVRSRFIHSDSLVRQLETPTKAIRKAHWTSGRNRDEGRYPWKPRWNNKTERVPFEPKVYAKATLHKKCIDQQCIQLETAWTTQIRCQRIMEGDKSSHENRILSDQSVLWPGDWLSKSICDNLHTAR